MFESLTDRLNHTIKKLRGQAVLTEENVRDALREIRLALLEADVALPVVKIFLDRVKEKAMGQEVLGSLSPAQALVKIVNDELIAVMGDACEELNLAMAPPAVILMSGLQGSGKTTTVAKLAHLLKGRHNKTVMVTSADVYRPAAIDQLKVLADQVDATFFPSNADMKPVNIARDALSAARRNHSDVLIVDTAGRLHVDDALMDEIKALHKVLDPIETLFVVDSMTGQDAANTAAAFNDALPLSGIILTKTDGDARGGAALSMREITGKPIKFLGVGEKINELEPFFPDRVASRILGMGDVISLVEDVERNVDEKKAEKLAKKIKKGKGFDFEDFRDQLQMMQKMGGVGSLLDKMPGMSNVPKEARDAVDDSEFKRLEAIINSMTPMERRKPEIIKGSRKRRIAAGSGTQIQDVNSLLKQFKQTQKMMKQMNKKGGQRQMMQMMANMQKGGGPGFRP